MFCIIHAGNGKRHNCCRLRSYNKALIGAATLLLATHPSWMIHVIMCSGWCAHYMITSKCA